MPPVEEDAHHQEGGVLVGPGVAQQEHPLRVELGEKVGGGSVHKGDSHLVERRHSFSRVSLHAQGPVLEAPHGVDPGLLGGVDEASVYPAGHGVLLLPRHVGTLPRLAVVAGPVERHELVALLVLVVHLVPRRDGDLVHLYRTPGLAGHQDLRRDNLQHQR